MTVEQRPILSEAESRAVRRGVPDPGIPTPWISIPTLALWILSMATWLFATWLVLATDVPVWVTIPIHAAVTFLMFTVTHEATHHAAGRSSLINQLLGRLSVPFVASFASFPALQHVHIEHHRNTNEDRTIDPDSFSTHGPAWIMPFRWATQDLYYGWFWARRVHRRPRGEAIETLLCVAITIGGLAAAATGGWFWELTVIYLIPQRIGLATLAWWFDWLPHHGLSATHAENRYRATRVRVGMEWFLTPVLLYQNYHLVHHLHPSIPFYRYITAWNRNRDAYLARNSAIITAWGKELTPGEYRAWRHITESYAEASAQAPELATGATIHQLVVDEVRPLTDDAVSISFVIPPELRTQFRFVPGQHVALHVNIGATTHRRTYSICAAATSDVIRVGVRRIAEGTVSTFLTTSIKPGDTLGVEEPTGRFTLSPEAGRRQNYVAVAAGSGITPIISMVSSTLLVEEDSRFTLLYGNRSRESTMFAEDLEMLVRQFEGRLQIRHFLDGAPREDVSELDRAAAEDDQRDDQRLPSSSYHAGSITIDGLAEAVPDLTAVAGWYLCGPQPMVRAIRDTLIERAVPAEVVHLELFNAEPAARERPSRDTITTVTALLRGKRTTFAVDGTQSVLDGALDSSVNAPYACMGGACGTCRAKVIAGTVEMDQNLVLDDAEVAAGYVLTCQSFPTSDYVDIDYDS